MSRVWSVAVVFGVLLFAVPARADDDDLKLRWAAPEGCPSQADVRAASLRGVNGNAARALLEVDAVVAAESPGAGENRWNVRIRTRRQDVVGERTIAASSCEGLASATAVVIALALSTPDSDAPSSAPTLSSPVVEAKHEDEPAEAVSRQWARSLAVGASMAGNLANLPSAAVGGSLTAAWTPGRARIEIDARLWSGQGGGLSGTTSGADFALLTLGGRGCWAIVRAGALDLSPCLGADVNRVSATGYGSDKNFEPNAAWTAIAGGVLGRVSLTHWLALRGRADLTVPVTRPTFVVENEGTVHRPSSVGAAASLGLEALFL